MSDIAPIGRTSAAAVQRPGRPPKAPTAAAPTRQGDRVELSTHAQLLSRLSKLPDVRQNLVDQVRQQLAAGTYETPEKLDVAIDRLLSEDLTS